jgi:hypothetical protein
MKPRIHLASFFSCLVYFFNLTEACFALDPRIEDIINSRKVIFIGESHSGSFELVKDLPEVLASIKNTNKKTSIAIEMFRTKAQPVIDRFMQGTISSQYLANYLTYVDQWGWPPGPYIDLLSWAKTNGVDVYGIDSDRSREVNEREEDQTRAFSLMKNILPNIWREYGSFPGWYDIYRDYNYYRDTHMAAILGKLTSEYELVIVFSGSVHSYILPALIDRQIREDEMAEIHLGRKTGDKLTREIKGLKSFGPIRYSIGQDKPRDLNEPELSWLFAKEWLLLNH